MEDGDEQSLDKESVSTLSRSFFLFKVIGEIDVLIVFHNDNSIIHQLRKLISYTCIEVYIINLRDYLAYLTVFIRGSFYIKNKGFFFPLNSIV